MTLAAQKPRQLPQNGITRLGYGDHGAEGGFVEIALSRNNTVCIYSPNNPESRYELNLLGVESGGADGPLTANKDNQNHGRNEHDPEPRTVTLIDRATPQSHSDALKDYKDALDAYRTMLGGNREPGPRRVIAIPFHGNKDHQQVVVYANIKDDDGVVNLHFSEVRLGRP